MTVSVQNLRDDLNALTDPEKATILRRFFKTGPGEYGEGDQFLGIPVPAQRRLVKRYRGLALGEAMQFVVSPWHEYRLTGLLILVEHYSRGNEATREAVFTTYLAHAAYVNNWDLVDTTAPKIVGAHTLNGAGDCLMPLAQSALLWERRIAMVATLAHIQAGQLDWTLRLAEQLLADPEDLLHKACGWMLREAWKRDAAVVEAFLDQFAPRMPRVMLRYAIERMPEARRKGYLAVRKMG